MPKIKNVSQRLVYAFDGGRGPGQTWDVTKEEYDKAQKSAHWGRSFGPGDAAMPAAPEPARTSLAGLPEGKALAEIERCSSVDVLAIWHGKEKRPKVVEAIEARTSQLAGSGDDA